MAMKKKILIFGILILAIALSGCTQPAAGTVYKYVCSDGTIVDTPGLCPAEGEIDFEIVCVDYCNGDQPAEANTVEYIKSEMSSSNYCQVPGDCNVSDTKCPLGCYNLVNNTELGRINALVDSFRQTCLQTCTPLTEIICEEGKCTPVEVGTG